MRLGSPSGVPGLRGGAPWCAPPRCNRLTSTERSSGAVGLDQTPGRVLGEVPPKALQVGAPELRSALTPKPPRPQSALEATGTEPSFHVD